MLGKVIKYGCLLTLFVAIAATAAHAGPATLPGETYSSQSQDDSFSPKDVHKIRPSGADGYMGKSWSNLGSGFKGLSQYNPADWGMNCFLPTPAKGQFVIGPRVWFTRVSGEVRRGLDTPGAASSIVRFDDHLGFRRTGNTVWSVDALYQFRPRWGFRYSFTPITMESTASPLSGFTFMGQSFAAGGQIHSRWQRYEHRAGLVFNLSQKPYSLTNFFAEWLYVQDKLSIGPVTGTTPLTVSWDDDKNLVLLGLEFNKCLKNYKGNTVALSARGGLGFLDDSLAYDAEAAISYLIPIRAGRFGFVKGGYHYFRLQRERDRDRQIFNTSTDGAFFQLGFLF